MVRSLVIASLLALALWPLWRAAASAHEGTEISVKGDVRPNSTIQLEGEEFAANDSVRIELRKEGVEPILLGRISADAKGAFIAELHVPASVTPGIYRLAAEGKESATTTVTVLSAAGGQAAEPGEGKLGELVRDRSTEETIGLGAFTLLLAAGGSLALRLSRTRAHQGQA